MQPIKLNKERKLSNCWNPKGKVWYQHNDDSRNTKGDQLVRALGYGKQLDELSEKDYKEAHETANWVNSHFVPADSEEYLSQFRKGGKKR